MIIGVDAGALSVTDDRLKVGVYYITLNLLTELCKINRKFQYHLYSFKPISSTLLKAIGTNAINIVIRPKIGWYTFRLPIEMLVKPPDVYLGLSQSIPIFSPKKTIGFIYDLAFLHYPSAYPDSLNKLTNLTNHVIKRSSHIIAISQSTKVDILANHTYDANDISVSYLGINTWFKPNGSRLLREKPYFLFVGALKKIKNITRIISAFQIFLKTAKREFDLLLVGGDYWPDTDITKTISDYNLNKRIFLLGPIDNKKLPKYYRGAIALLSPSLWEGFCLPVIEAMACGCPVIASTQGSLPEVIGDAGLLVNPFHIEDIAKNMRAITNNLNMRQTLIRRGLARSKVYQWDKFAQSVYDTMQMLGWYI